MNIRNWTNHYCEASRGAPSELAFRNIVNLLIPSPELAWHMMTTINQLDLNMVLVSLKSLCLIHR